MSDRRRLLVLPGAAGSFPARHELGQMQWWLNID